MRDILSWPDGELDYGRAKLALDALIDPSANPATTMTELNGMAEAAAEMAGSRACSAAKLDALRTIVYKPGPWNDYRAFDYDHSNLRGRNVQVKLISHYLATRRGDCVSMPFLFLILAEKLGLDMAVSSVPLHYFLRHRDEEGRVVNLETTSGALPARDIWLRQIRPVSDLAVVSGLYLRTLSRRETAAAMATTVLQHLRDSDRLEEAVAVAEIILRHNPRDGLVLANLGNLYGRLGADLVGRYGDESRIPPSLQPGYWLMVQCNHAAFAAAKALGWEYCV